MRAPISGSVGSLLVRSGDLVRAGQQLMSLLADETQVWEALRVLYLIGESSDAGVVSPFTGPPYPERIRQQAQNTLEKIQGEKHETH